MALTQHHEGLDLEGFIEGSDEEEEVPEFSFEDDTFVEEISSKFFTSLSQQEEGIVYDCRTKKGAKTQEVKDQDEDDCFAEKYNSSLPEYLTDTYIEQLAHQMISSAYARLIL